MAFSDDVVRSARTYLESKYEPGIALRQLTPPEVRELREVYVENIAQTLLLLRLANLTVANGPYNGEVLSALLNHWSAHLTSLNADPAQLANYGFKNGLGIDEDYILSATQINGIVRDSVQFGTLAMRPTQFHRLICLTMSEAKFLTVYGLLQRCGFMGAGGNFVNSTGKLEDLWDKYLLTVWQGAVCPAGEVQEPPRLTTIS